MKSLFVLTMLAVSAVAHAATVNLNFIDAKGVTANAGTVQLEDTPYGLLLTPQLSGLPAGTHGFHVHEKASCDAAMVDGKMVAGAAAGGHWDPEKTAAHLGPYTDKGHKGDLPALYADANGTVTQPVLAPRLKIADLAGHSLMVHVGGDNHSDHPAKFGGGGIRLACAIL